MDLERIDDLAIVRMRGGKANAMSREFLISLADLFERAENSDARAIVLVGYDKYFSAGLALPSLISLDRSAIRDFIELFSATMLQVFRCPRPVIAAVNGHAIAGGCVLAMMADFRVIAAGGTKIGLNEVQLGIGLPSVVVEPLRLQVPPRSLLPIALEGTIFTAEEARDVGLVEEIAEPSELEARAISKARVLAKAPRTGVSQVKLALRRPAIEAIETRGAAERERWLDTWFSDAARQLIQSTVDKLKSAR
jgi:enoyl-CoA hydratase